MCLGMLCDNMLTLMVACLNLNKKQETKFKFFLVNLMFYLIAFLVKYLYYVTNRSVITLIYQMNISLFLMHLIMIFTS